MRFRLAVLIPLMALAALLFTRLHRAGAAGDPAPGKGDKGPPPGASGDKAAEPAAAAAPADGAAPAAGDSAAPAEEDKELPLTEVTVGVYLNQIHTINIKDNEYTATFWLWFRWKGELNPLESFEIVGGRIESKDAETREELDGGVHYAAIRVLATVTHFFEVKDFPLDSHTLTIQIEDADHEDHEVKYVADAVNSQADPGVKAPGFVIGKPTATVVTHTYTTNYGDTSLATGAASNYSSFEFKLPLLRKGLGYYIKLFWGGWLAVMVALLAMFIKPTDLDPRFGLGVGALFAAMASAYVVTQSLPDTQVMTLADKINALGISYIFLSVIESTVSLRLFTAGKEDASKKLDKIGFWALLISFAVVNVVVVVAR